MGKETEFILEDYIVPEDKGFADRNRKSVKTSPRKKKIEGHFIMGPLPLDWFIRLCDLRPSCFKVALALFYHKGYRKKAVRDKPVKLTNRLLEKMGLHRSTKSRDLAEMEAADLVKVHKQGNKAVVVEILEYSAAKSENNDEEDDE